MKRNLLLISNSTNYGGGYLDHCAREIGSFLFRMEVTDLLFVPYARPSGKSHEDYANQTCSRLQKIGLRARSVHEAKDPKKAVLGAAGLFVGGGNTFLLLKELYDADVVEAIQERVYEGMPYIGASAGSNVAGLTISTTNDMPIVYPPSFEALGLVPFNINPHYIDIHPEQHMGETRATRINEFHVFNEQPVVGLREGAMLRIKGDNIKLLGSGARIFRKGKQPVEYKPDDMLDFLLGRRLVGGTETD